MRADTRANYANIPTHLQRHPISTISDNREPAAFKSFEVTEIDKFGQSTHLIHHYQAKKMALSAEVDRSENKQQYIILVFPITI